MLRVLHVIPGIAACYGGPSTVICQMVAALNEIPNVQAEIATTDADGAHGRVAKEDLPALPIHMFRRTWSEQWKYSTGLRRWLVEHAREYDVVHIHAVWAHSTVVASKVTRKHGVPYVVRPAGMFSRWSLDQRQWKKRVAWHTYHRRHVARANVIHVTAEQEANDVRAMRLVNPIAVVPNGVAMPESRLLPENESSRKRVLFLGRIHPVKGLANFLRAWQHARLNGEWELVLVGPDENGHLAEVQALAAELQLADCVRFVGPVGAQEKWQWYQSARIFVLPSFTENFSVAVAEALAAGLPVITTTGTPWNELRERRCGWYVEPTVDALATALREAVGLSDSERIEMGQRGATWARERFSWPAVAQELQQLYSWLRNGGTAPSYVQF